MMLSKYKFSFMGNIQLQVVKEDTILHKPVSVSDDHVSTAIDIPVSNNAALFIKFHSLSFMNGLKRHFQASDKIINSKN